MNTTIRVVPHLVIAGATVIELWYGDQFIGPVAGCDDGPGVRVISKHEKTAAARGPLMIEVRIHC